MYQITFGYCSSSSFIMAIWYFVQNNNTLIVKILFMSFLLFYFLLNLKNKEMMMMMKTKMKVPRNKMRLLMQMPFLSMLTVHMFLLLAGNSNWQSIHWQPSWHKRKLIATTIQTMITITKGQQTMTMLMMIMMMHSTLFWMWTMPEQKPMKAGFVSTWKHVILTSYKRF